MEQADGTTIRRVHAMIGDKLTRMVFFKKCSDGVMLMMLCLFMFQSSAVYADSDGDAMLSLALTRYHQGDSTKAISALTEASQIGSPKQVAVKF